MSIKKSLFNFFAVVAIAACGGGGGGAPEPAPVPAPPPAPTASISASPTTVYVDEDITLTWSSTNASSCEASDSWEGSKDPSGEEVVTATTNGDLTYTITCSGNGSAAASVVVSAEYEPQFNEDPVVISNIKLYSEVCTAYYSNTFPWIEFVIPVNINDDEWDDFIVHQSCKINDDYRSNEVTDPTPDLLIVYISNDDGTYRNGNSEVFGEDIPSLGAGSRKYVRGDINGDGRDDFAFAMHNEDGRSGVPSINSRASPAVILSKDETQYEIKKIGTPDWGHAAEIIKREDEVDVLFNGFTGVGLQALRYEDGSFIDVSDQYPSTFKTDENGRIVDWGSSQWSIEFKYFNGYIIGVDKSSQNDAPAIGIGLWKKESNNDWVKLDQDLNQIEFYIDYITWQGDPISLPIYNYNGRYVANLAPQTMCFFKTRIDDSENISFLALYQSQALKEGEIIEGESYQSSDFFEIQPHKLFQIENDAIVEISGTFDVYDDKVFANFIDCRDLNNDGYSDFARHVWSRTIGYEVPRTRGGAPVLNVNRGDGEMLEYESNTSSLLPGHSQLMEANQGQGYFRDVNGDGIEDLVLFGMEADNPYESYDGSIEIYLGRYSFALRSQ